MQSSLSRHAIPIARKERHFIARKEITASPETHESKVRLRCQALVEEIWEGTQMNRITVKVFDGMCDAPEADHGIYTPEKRRDAEILFETIYTWARAHRMEGEKMLTFSQELREVFFFKSPNVFNYLLPEDMILSMAKWRTIPGLGSIVQSQIGEIVYALSFAEKGWHELDRILMEKNISTEVRFSLLSVFQEIAKNSTYESYSRTLLPTCGRFLADFKRHEFVSQDLLMTYAVEVVEKKIHEYMHSKESLSGEVQSPTAERDLNAKQEDDWWRKRIQLHTSETNGGLLVRVAKDVVALVDKREHLPLLITTIPKDIERLSVASLDPRGVDTLLRGFASSRYAQAAVVDSLLEFLSQAHTPLSGEERSFLLHKLFPENSTQEVNELLDGFIERDAFQERYASHVAHRHQEVDLTNEKLFRTMRLFIEARLPRLTVLAQTMPLLQNWLETFLQAPTGDALLKCYQNLGISIEMRYRKSPSVNLTELTEILSFWDGIKERQQQNYQKLQAEVRSLEEKLVRERPARDRRVDLLSNDPARKELLRDVLEEIKAKYATVTEVPSYPVDRFEEQKEILPRGSSFAVDSATLWRELQRPEIRERLSTDLSIDLRELTLREQIQLLSFMATTELAKQRELFTLIRRHGLPAARAFLACEYGEVYAEAIQKIAANHNPEVANKIFEKYTQVIDVVDQISLEFSSSEGQATSRVRTTNRVREELVRRAKDVLVFSTNATESDILERLERYRSDQLLSSALFKSLVKERKIVSFEAFKNFQLEERTIVELTSIEREEIRAIIFENWKSSPFASPAEMERELFPNASLRQLHQTYFQLLKLKDEIVGFVRFEPDDRAPHGIRGDYLNLRQTVQESGIGEALLQRAIDQVAKKHKIFAEFFAGATVGSLYIEKFGFVGVGVGSREVNGKTERWIEIEREDSQEKATYARAPEVTLSVLKRWANNEQCPAGVTIAVLRGNDIGESCFQRIAQETATIPKRYLSRYLTEGVGDQSVHYFVFETELFVAMEVPLKAAA